MGLLADSASKPCDRLDDLSLAETLVVAAKHINIHRLQRIVIQRFLAERKDHSGGAVFGAHSHRTLHVKNRQWIVQIKESFQRLRIAGTNHADRIAEHVQEIREIPHTLFHRLRIAASHGEHRQRIGWAARHLAGKLAQLLRSRFGINQRNLNAIRFSSQRMRHHRTIRTKRLHLP